ncbi:alpha/beta fold hydrolase [Sphingomonas soli]|uniref:alpha/beta fold hydrolase n=1 Tax=Sphingomonas soli TaxID=266127 RepID=UPI00082A0B3D|nr:alpha/beta hydrolase [Sphingomonas soli]
MIWVVLGIVALIAALAGWSFYVNGKIEAAIPAEGATIEAGGVRFHYRDLGPRDAPPVLMIHGVLSNWRIFTYALAPAMARDHRVIVIDRPGWGYSKSGARLDIAGQADAIAALIDRLELSKPLLVGHSMGGAVSLALGLAHPDKVRGLALIAPLTQPIERPPEPFKGYVVPAFLRAPIAWTLAIPIAMRTGKARTMEVFHPEPVPEDFAVKGGGMLAMRPAGFQSGAFELGMAKGAMDAQAPRYGTLKLPVAILYAHGDTLLDPELHGTDTAAAIPGATVEIVEGGHMLPVTQPGLVEAWLRRL